MKEIINALGVLLACAGIFVIGYYFIQWVVNNPGPTLVFVMLGWILWLAYRKG